MLHSECVGKEGEFVTAEKEGGGAENGSGPRAWFDDTGSLHRIPTDGYLVWG